MAFRPVFRAHRELVDQSLDQVFQRSRGESSRVFEFQHRPTYQTAMAVGHERVFAVRGGAVVILADQIEQSPSAVTALATRLVVASHAVYVQSGRGR